MWQFFLYFWVWIINLTHVVIINFLLFSLCHQIFLSTLFFSNLLAWLCSLKKLLRNSFGLTQYTTRITCTTVSQWNLIIQRKPLRNYWNTATYVCVSSITFEYYVFKILLDVFFSPGRCLLFRKIHIDPIAKILKLNHFGSS